MAAGLMSALPAFGRIMLLCVLPVAAFAQNLPDPTRPPAGIGMGPAGQGGAWAGQITAHPSSGLQTVIISPGRRAAIINGKMVELGEKFGNAKLIEVSERGVVLQGRYGKRELALFPGVRLRMRSAAPPKHIEPANQAPEEKE